MMMEEEVGEGRRMEYAVRVRKRATRGSIIGRYHRKREEGVTQKEGRLHLQDVLTVVAFDDNPLPGLLSFFPPPVPPGEQ